MKLTMLRWPLNTYLLLLYFSLLLIEPGILQQTKQPNSDGGDPHHKCSFEELPTHLNSLAYLTLDEEVHLHGEYRVNISEWEKQTYFELQRESVFRVYVAPHASDVDLWLYNITGEEAPPNIGHSSLNIGTEEVIRKTLPAGNYSIRFAFFGVWIGNYDPQECDTLVLELEIVPKDRLLSRTNPYRCPSQQTLPDISMQPLETGQSVTYNSDTNAPTTIMNVRLASSTDPSAVTFVKGYNFTIPSMQDRPLWKLEATLGTEFILGGSLSMLLHLQKEAPIIDCTWLGNCTVGERHKINENILRTVLTPGDYTLWIIDSIGEKDSSLIPGGCVPFSFSFSLTTEAMRESFLTCEAPHLPDSLLPGLFDYPPGYFHYRESVLLDLSEREHEMNLVVDTPSYFRVLTAEHRVDIDLELKNIGTGETEGSYKFEGEESIIAKLQPGNYNLTISYFGNYDLRFCETFDLEIALSPISLYSRLPQTCTTSPPDLSTLQSLLDRNGTYRLDPSKAIYTFNFEANYEKRNIASYNFTVGTQTAFKGILGDDFLTGDLEMQLINYNDQMQMTRRFSKHRRNMEVLTEILEAGSYTLVISTGPSQKSGIQGFPACATYSLELDIKPLSTASTCWPYLSLPKDLNNVQYLGVNGIVHVQDQFLAPFTRGSTAWIRSERVRFKVVDPSFFRIWTEVNHIDVDFYLYETGRLSPVASTIGVNEEEEILYKLEANKQYELLVNYYHYSHSAAENFVDPDCFLVNLQFAIVPLADYLARISTCEDSLPGQDLIPPYSPTQTTFFSENQYFFTQTSAALLVELPFTVAPGDFLLFRADLRYNFLWSDLDLRLVMGNDTLAYAKGEFDHMDLETTLLNPGDYILQIYEVADFELVELHSCQSFYLMIGYEVQSRGTPSFSSLAGCPSYPLPASLNSIGQLSALTGYKSHFVRNALVDVSARRSFIEFNLDKPSLFSMFIPRHPVIDVDITLRSGKRSDSTTWRVIKVNNGVIEESMINKLDVGPYFLEFKFYGQDFAPLPNPSDCVYFPIEFSIVPTLDYLDRINNLTTACSTTFPTSIVTNVASHNMYQRNMTQLTPSFEKTLSFALEEPALFHFVIEFPFVAGAGLSLDLVGNVDEGLSVPVTRTYYSELGYNRAYFGRILEKGTYNLTIHDPFPTDAGSSRDNKVVCSPYMVHYNIKTTDLPVNFCDDTQLLPTDLFTTNGGSIPYGGPQDSADGTVHIWGEQFLEDDSNGRDHDILFKIMVPSYVRLFAKMGADDDIDF